MAMTKFPNGISSLGMPIVPTTGTVFFVDDSGSNSYAGTDPSEPFADLDYAIGRCTANVGDIIFLMPGHAESNATVITADVAGISIIGLGRGGQRPVFTVTGTVDAITVTAADVLIENVEFAIPGIDAVTADINVAGAGCVIKDTVHHGSTGSENKVEIITLATGADDCHIDGALIYNDTVEVVGGIVIEAALKRLLIENVVVHDSIGFTNGSLSDEATALQLTIRNCVFSNAKADTVVLDLGNNTTAIVMNTYVNGAHTTLASNISTGNAVAFFECYTCDESKSKNGILNPAVDAD